MKRTRLTISIGTDVLTAVDQLIDGVHIRNRSHAIESLLAEGLNIISLKTAVIMAGGKNAIKRIPAIKKSLELLKQNGIFDLKIAVGYLGDQIKDKINPDSKASLKIEYIEGGQGTGGALLTLKNKIKSDFLVVNLENPASCDLKNLIQFHRKQKPVITAATKDLNDYYGIYVLDPQIFNYLPKGFSMLENEVFAKLMKEGKLLFYPILEY